jgi:hypothetical protein
LAFHVRKTEHTGPKRGKGGLWGTKWEAKHASSRLRRTNARREIGESLSATCLRARLKEAAIVNAGLDRTIAAEWSAIDESWD